MKINFKPKKYNLSSRIQKWYTINNQSFFISYFNNNKSNELAFTGIQNGQYFSIASFEPNKWDQGSKVQVYAVRLYNRGLSEDEIRQNYEIDKVRFNIQD